MKRAARKQIKKFGKGGLNLYASMMADKLKSPKMSPAERDRIQRAVDQGFTNIVYHSTDTPWDEIDLNYTDVGLHAGTPTQAANRALDKAIEAKLQERREQGQYIDTTNVLPLAYRPGKTLRMPDVGEFKDAYTTLLDMRTAPELRGQGWMHTLFDDVDLQKNAYPGKQSKDWLDSMENRMALAEIRRNLLDRGYRQIVYPNTHENAYGELTNLLPEYQDQLDQLSRDADALYQKSLSMRPQAPQPGATEQEIEAFLHPRDPLSYLDPEEAALYNKYRNEMQRIEMSPGAYETGESIIFLDPADVRSVYARFAPEAAQETGLGKKQGGLAKFGKGGLNALDMSRAGSKISALQERVRQKSGEYAARRVERAADEIPNLGSQYSDEALRRAFMGDNTQLLMTMPPDSFEEYAARLIPGQRYQVEDSNDRLAFDDYIDYLGKIARGDGLSDVPYLTLTNPKGYGDLEISGHEGRHRTQALTRLGDDSTLIRLYPEGYLREMFPRQDREEFIQLFRDYLGEDTPLVMPEEELDEFGESVAKRRRKLRLPEFYAGGGLVDPAQKYADGGPVYDPSRINQMVDDLLDPMYEFEPYDDEAYEVQRFAKGGLPTPQRQWLKDAVENEVKRFQQTTAGGMDPQQALQQLQQSMQEADFQALPEGTRNAFQRSQEDLQRKAALNAWLGGTATKYIKRDYGTEQDPLTQLQMRHTEGEWPPRYDQMYANTPPAVRGIQSDPVSRFLDPNDTYYPGPYREDMIARNPWISTLNPDERIYTQVNADELNISHLVDEIQNAMNPSAGLPRNLQIRPESLQRMSFPQASELVGKINQYRAEQMAAANAQRATNPATQLVKQYPEGYRWVQITPDADIPEGWQRLNSGDYRMPDGTITSRGWAERAVGDALKYEGDTMGHCVGGYCDSVMSGASRIYSLRDAQGMPHVTIEAVPEFHPEEADFNEYWNALKPRLREQGEIPDRNKWFDMYLESTRDFAEEAAKLLGNRQRIIQIKGKGNRAPVDQYVPFVQDFVRSQDWTDVQELNNARLRDATREFSGRPQPQQRYMTDAEYDDYLLQLLRDEQAPGMKEGGDVKTKSMLDELAEAVLAGSAGFGAQVTPDEYGNRGLVSATLSTPELLGLIPGGAQYIPAASGVASADYDEHLNNMLARYGLTESADLDTLDKFALAMGETVGQIPILPARGVAALKRFAPTLFKSRTIPGARAVDIATKPIRAAAEYFSPTAEISPSMLAAATGIGGGLRTYFGNDPIAEPSNDADYDDLMQMLRRNAAIDLPSTRELTAKMPARPMRERMAYTPPSFPGMAKGGPVYDPARIESMVNELMEPQKLAKGGLPTPPKGLGKDVPRAETPDADYLTPAEREFLNRSVRTGMQVSERVPTSTKFEGDPYDPSLTIGVDVIRQSPEQMRKQAETMSQYANYPVSAPTDPESVFGLLGDQSVENLLFLYDQVPEDVRRMSSRWYEGANRIADEAATKYGIPIEGAAGVYASLSPQMDWFKNISLGDRVMEIANNYGDFRFSPEMARRAQYLIDKPKGGFNEKTAAIVDLIKDRSLNELDSPLKKAVWLRLYDEAYNPRGYNIVDPLGNVIGSSKTGKGEDAKVGWGSLKEIAKALSIFQDPTMENINRMLGEMHKVRSFYNNIVDPYTGRSVTSDTHNVAAALMRPLSGTSPEVEHNLGGASSSNLTGARGTYGLYADAVRQAAAERGVTDPRAMQSITWEAIRGLYSPESKRSDLLQDEVANAMNQYRLGRTTSGETREQLLDIGGGIDLPAWYAR